MTDMGGCKRQPEHRNQGRARRTEEEDEEGCNTSLHKPTNPHKTKKKKLLQLQQQTDTTRPNTTHKRKKGTRVEIWL
jgi:hypothetical protein